MPRGAWYGLLSGFIGKENVPLKHPITLKIHGANWLYYLHESGHTS